MATELELGQMCFGNPAGDYGTDRYVDDLVEVLLLDIGRIHRNVYQREWDRIEDPRLFGVCFRPYYWGDDEGVASLPNLRFAHSPQEIRWYKYPGRGQSCTIKWGANGWRHWFMGAMEIIERNDMRI